MAKKIKLSTLRQSKIVENSKTDVDNVQVVADDDGKANLPDADLNADGADLIDGDADLKRKRKRKRKAKAADEMAQKTEASQDDNSNLNVSSSSSFVNERTIYIEGLPFTSTEDDVKEFFKSCGSIISVRLPRWHDSGRLRG